MELVQKKKHLRSPSRKIKPLPKPAFLALLQTVVSGTFKIKMFVSGMMTMKGCEQTITLAFNFGFSVIKIE